MSNSRTWILFAFFGITALPYCTPASADEFLGFGVPTRLAVLPISSQVKIADTEISGRATALLLRNLSQRRQFDIVAPEEVQKAIESSGLRGEPSIEDQMRIGKQVNADRVARFTLLFANVPRKARRALELHGEVIRATDGELATRVYARTKALKPQSSTVSDVEAALEELTTEVVNQMVELDSLFGVVGSKKLSPFVRISLGIREGLRPGAEVEFLSDTGESLGYGDAVEVDTAHSLIRVHPVSSYARVVLNTHVRPIYNPPPYAAGLTYAQLDAHEEKCEQRDFLVALGLALAGIELYNSDTIHLLFHGSD